MTYELKKKLTVKEFNEVSKLRNTTNRFSRKLLLVKPEERDALEDQIEAAEGKFDEQVYTIVAKCYGLERENIDNLDNKEFMEMWNRLFTDSVYIPKNLEKQSQSTSNSTIPTQSATPA